MSVEKLIRDSDRFESIDGLRGIAILLVTMLHLWGLSGAPAITFSFLDFTPFFRMGGIGVRIFFALSGFCLFYPIARSGGGAFQIRRFFLRRALRIWPAHFIGIFVWLAIWGPPHKWLNWEWQLVSHLTFIHTFFTDTIQGFNGVLWSLGVEIHFYLVFPLLAWLMYRWPWRTLGACFLVSTCINVAALMLFDPSIPEAQLSTLLTMSLPGHAFEFACGMAAATLVVRYPVPSRRLGLVAWGLGAVGLFVMPYVPVDAMVLMFMRYAYAPCWMMLIYAAVAVPSSVGARLLRCGLFVGCGIISYSLYIYNDAMKWLPQRIVPGIQQGSWGWIAAALGVVVVAGGLGYLVTEKPFIELRRRLRPRREAA